MLHGLTIFDTQPCPAIALQGRGDNVGMCEIILCFCVCFVSFPPTSGVGQLSLSSAPDAQLGQPHQLG